MKTLKAYISYPLVIPLIQFFATPSQHPSLFVQFPIDLLAYALSRFLSMLSNRRLEHRHAAYTHARIESHRKTRHAWSCISSFDLTSSRGRETENNAMRMARNEGTKIARGIEKMEESRRRTRRAEISARRNKNSPLLLLILFSLFFSSFFPFHLNRTTSTLCRKRRHEMEWGRDSGNLRLDDYRSIEDR